MYIDSHLHLTKKDYDISVEEFINKSKEKNVNKLILSCNNIDSIKEGLKLSKKYENVYLSIGFAPHYLEEFNEESFKYLESIITNEKIVAVGEIGLDYYYTKDNIDDQKHAFKKQIELATKYNLPVVIHTRCAYLDTINILKEYEVSGVIHCFEGSLKEAQSYIDIGFYLGIGGLVTFENHNLKDIIKDINVENILLETDSPYLSPVPFRGKKNGSWNIPIIAEKISGIKNIKVEKIAEITTKNCNILFDLK